MRETGLLSVVIPAYHEEAMIEKTAHTIGTMLRSTAYRMNFSLSMTAPGTTPGP